MSQRKRASVRREEILSAAVGEIEEVGSSALRIADVARRLGISPGLVLYHFATRETLVAAAFAHAAENDLAEARRIAAVRKPARARLSDVLEWYGPTGTSRSWRIWIDGWAAGMFNEELESTMDRLDRSWKQLIADLIEEGRLAGELSSDDPAKTATRVSAFLDGLTVQNVARRGRVSREQITEWVEAFIASETAPPS